MGRNLQNIIWQIYRIADHPTRDAIKNILPFLHDPILSPYAITTLSRINDSRTFFPVLSHFLKPKNIQEVQRSLQYFFTTKDPRAQEFLENYLTKEVPFKEIAQTALQQCQGNSNFIYRYMGNEENYERAREIKEQIVLNTDNLQRYQHIIRENALSGDGFKPQTYVVLQDETIVIGGYINEHVDVAQGSDVLAAGEITFDGDGEEWIVNYINNRSNGYLPHHDCFPAVKRALQKPKHK